MRVLHLGTSDSAGGAARAMYRWHSSLLKLDVESQILCLNKSAEDESVSVVSPNWEESSTVECGGLQRYFIEANRTAYSGTYFSHPLGYVSIAGHELVQGADVIHVHWTSLFFDWQEIRKIKALGKTVVLTPHDLWPITGGCHYPKGCEGYLRECLDCPMVQEDPFKLISNSRALKQNVLADAVDVILSPSHWMDQAFRNVESLKNVRKAVIPYCVNVSQLRAKPREYSKQELGFEPGRRLVLFCAEYVAEGRKGLDQLIDVLKTCESRQELRSVLEPHAEFALIGKGSELVEISTIFRVHRRGYVKTTDELCRYYSAADLVIYLGLEDNLPNVILEAMACGTPSLAFDTGGVGDMIEDGVIGHLAPQRDVKGFAEKLAVLLSDSRKLSWLGINARERTLSQFSEGVVGIELLRLYEALSPPPKDSARQKTLTFDESPFQAAVQRTIRKAMGKGFRLMDDEIRALRLQLTELRADLEREKQRSLWDIFKERFTRLVFDAISRS